MYEKEKTLILSGDLRFSAENECLVFVSFSAVNGIHFRRHFRLRPKIKKKCFSVGSSIHHKKSLGLGLEKKS